MTERRKGGGQQVYVANRRDNVATALRAVRNGPAFLIGAVNGEGMQVEIIQPLDCGHKAALTDIPAGAPVIKYGAVIGRATADIPKGGWVHLHNIASLYDRRSSVGIDAKTGKVCDTKYE